MKSNHAKLDMSGFQKIQRAVRENKNRPEVIHIGVLATSEREGGSNNAKVGAAHEYGAPSKNIPRRSFLRMPLLSLSETMKKEPPVKDIVIHHVAEKHNIRPWLDKIAGIAMNLVLSAFASDGFGRWAAHSPDYSKRSKSGQILVDTGQLRDSVTWEVVKK
jgi:phage gpG-like protein